MHAIGHQLPTRLLGIGMDAWGSGHALTLRYHLRGLRNDQTTLTRTLRVVERIECARLIARTVSTHTRQWRHHNTVLQLKGTYLQWCE